MNDTFEFTLNNPLTEEQWDMITDVDMERTDSVTFHTKHGKEVEFAKVRHGKWFIGTVPYFVCSECKNRTPLRWDERRGYVLDYRSPYCPNCGAKMDGTERKEE